MSRAPTEDLRLAALAALRLTDGPEERFERLIAIARHSFGSPMAGIAIIGRDHAHMKAEAGIGRTSMAKPEMLWAELIRAPGPLVIEDALADPRVRHDPWVARAPHVRAYAGCLLRAPGGAPIGFLCVLAPGPRSFSAEDVGILGKLAELAQAELGAAQVQHEALQAAHVELRGQQAELEVLYRNMGSQQDELLQIYAELQRHNESVEAEVATRTQELKAANARLQEADRYKDEFLSVISHELRTPLNFIMGFASTLADEVHGRMNDKQMSAAARILNGADRMLLLVDDLLDYAQLTSGRFDLRRAPTPYTLLLDEAIAVMEPLASQKGLTLTQASPGTGSPVVDRGRVTQILTNLLANAIKFTPSGGAVAVRAFLRDGALVTEVADSGVGVAREDVPRMFERFRQLDMSSTREAGGTGLGLTITKALVEAHGGAIEVDSEPGKGSVFRFILPFGLSERPPVP